MFCIMIYTETLVSLLHYLKKILKRQKNPKRSASVGLESLTHLTISPGQGAGVAAHCALHWAKNVVQGQLLLTTACHTKGPILPLA